jgi:hypothetical protein
MYRVSGDTEILERMSPMLRGVVALEAHRPWLRRVWYLDPQLKYTEGPLSSELRSEQEAFVAQLACALMHCSFVSEERIPVGSLYILRRGLCSRGWNFLGPGRVWGEDLIVNYPQLIDTTPTVALTYVEVLRLAHPPPAPPPLATALTALTALATATLSSTALAAATLTAISMTTTTNSLQVLRLDRADMFAVAMMHPVVEERIKRAAVRRHPLNARPRPCDVAVNVRTPARSLCLPLAWQKRIALARFLLRHLRLAKKSKEKRWKAQQMDVWKNRQMAQISTAASRSQLGGFNAEAMRGLVRDELRKGVDDALQRAMPELAKMVVAEQRRAAHAEGPTTPASGAFTRSRSGRPTREGLLADLKDLWA